MERIDVAQALIEREGRVLVVRNRRHEHEGYSGWGFPGGRRERGETLAEAAVRETREETGVTIEAERLVSVGEWLHASHDLFAVFAANVVDGDPAVQPTEQVVVELEWVEPEEADRRMPWYPGGVRALMDATTTVYFADRAASSED